MAPYIEVGIVFTVLSCVVLVNGAQVTDILSSIAGLLTFICTQIAFDMNEQLQALPSENITERPRYRALFMMKECIWVLTYLLLASLPLLASTGVFASYPYWRRKLRAPR